MELDEVLLDELFDQKECLILWASEIDNTDLKKWAKDWACKELKCPDLIELARQLDQGASSQQKMIPQPVLLLHIVAMAHKIAVEKFESGDFDASLKQAFSIQFWLGERQGRKNQCAILNEEKASNIHKENRALKHDAIEFFINDNLEHLSNEKAASELAKKINISTRKLAEYISDYKKFLKICNQSNLGQSFLQQLEDFHRKFNESNNFSLTAITNSVDLLKKEFHEYRITSFMSCNLKDKKKPKTTEQSIIAHEDFYAKQLLEKLNAIAVTSSQ